MQIRIDHDVKAGKAVARYSHQENSGDTCLFDLPATGSLVSRILSGERNLTKKHIQALSKRFGISPAGFFD